MIVIVFCVTYTNWTVHKNFGQFWLRTSWTKQCPIVYLLSCFGSRVHGKIPLYLQLVASVEYNMQEGRSNQSGPDRIPLRGINVPIDQRGPVVRCVAIPYHGEPADVDSALDEDGEHCKVKDDHLERVGPDDSFHSALK